jgi:selenocysteine lyase/cysteine desulfurase
MKVSLQGLERSDAATAAGLATRVRVALAFFNTAAEVDRMLDVAEKLT